MAINKNRLLRYTSLPVLLDIISKRELTLLNPASWDDRNDSYYIELYKSKKQLKTLLALCFTTKAETYHHWKVFSDGISGVCIQFDKNRLLDSLDSVSGIEYGPVDYPLIKDLRSEPPEIEELPFLKRRPYRDEGEFRVIYKSKSEALEVKPTSFDLGSIQKINLSPWIPKSVSDTVKHVIKNMPGCSGIRVSKTTLVDSTVWKNIATREHGITRPSTGRHR